MTSARERRDCCLFLRIFSEASPFLHFTWLLQTSHWLELGIYPKPTVGQSASCFFFKNCSTLLLQCEISYKQYINGCDCYKKLFTKVGTRQNCCVVWSDLWCVICPGYRLPKDWSSDWSFSLKVVLRRTTWVSNEIQGFVFFSPKPEVQVMAFTWFTWYENHLFPSQLITAGTFSMLSRFTVYFIELICQAVKVACSCQGVTLM